jgi:hypothetical protein
MASKIQSSIEICLNDSFAALRVEKDVSGIVAGGTLRLGGLPTVTCPGLSQTLRWLAPAGRQGRHQTCPWR